MLTVTITILCAPGVGAGRIRCREAGSRFGPRGPARQGRIAVPESVWRGLVHGDEYKPLLRSVLEDRFRLKTHTETKEVPGYDLVVAKGGPKLQASKGVEGHNQIYPGGLAGFDLNMAGLADMPASPAGRPVVNRTGLEGTFDIQPEYAQDDAAPSERPSFFTALQERPGLRLEPGKGPVETLVIDSCERIPAEN